MEQQTKVDAIAAITEDEEEKKEISSNELLPLLPIFRSKSLQNDTLLLQSVSASPQSLDAEPPSLTRNVSDGIALSNAALKERYQVRACRVEDAASIFKLLHETWPEFGDWRDHKYWTKQFLQNNEIYGFVIEQSMVNEHSKPQTANDSSETKTDEHNKTDNISDVADRKRIVGIALYQWNTPGPKDNWTWRETDFPVQVQSDFNNPKYAQQEYQETLHKEKEAEKEKVQQNINLDKHFSKLHTHFVHFTDIAIDPKYRGKGLGTQLVQTIIYSFPKNTKFGLEVETTNIAAVKVYSSCGFQIVRLVKDYYDRNRDCYKMTLVSNYTQSDMDQFFERCKMKHKQVRMKLLRESIENLTKQKSQRAEEQKTGGDGKEDAEQKKEEYYIPPQMQMDDGNYSADSVEIANKYLDEDEQDVLFMDNLLQQLGLQQFKPNFQLYGITKDELATLTVDCLPYVIEDKELRDKFEKWLMEYQQKEQQNKALGFTMTAPNTQTEEQ